MPKQDPTQDRNFDDLAKKFSRKIYGSAKGDIRLAVLERDFAAHTQVDAGVPLRILDAGGGQAQFSLELAARGHQVVVCDISSEMLAQAQAQAQARGLLERVTLMHCSVQELGAHFAQLGQPLAPFDVVICHAVMEWLSQPQALLPLLCDYVKPDGLISLIFFNRHSLVFKNLLRGNYKKVAEDDVAGHRGSLTPINPLDPQVVLGWVAELPLTCLAHSGIRVFHDYILDPQVARLTPDAVRALELQLSTCDPYRALGRYQHLLLRHKPAIK